MQGVRFLGCMGFGCRVLGVILGGAGILRCKVLSAPCKAEKPRALIPSP